MKSPPLLLLQPAIDAKVVEEELFGEVVHPVLLGDLLAFAPLAGARGHAFDLGHGGLADGAVLGGVLRDDGLHEVGALEDDAAAGVLGGDGAEVAEELAFREDIKEVVAGADAFLGELDDGAGLDGAGGADVVADAIGHGAERLALVVVVGIDDGDGQLGPHVDDEAAHLGDLIRREGELGADFRPDGAVGVIPGVVDAHVDEAAQPGLGEEVVDVRLAEAGGHAGEHAGVEAVLQAAEGAGEHVGLAAALVADDLGALDADERGDVSELAHGGGGFLGDHLAVGKDLEVGVRVHGEKVEELRVHEGLAAEDAEEGIAPPLGVVHDLVQLVEVQGLARLIDIDPAALAAEVAGVQDGNVKEGREELALLHALLVKHHRARPLVAEIPADLGQAKRIDGAQDAGGEGEEHGKMTNEKCRMTKASASAEA